RLWLACGDDVEIAQAILHHHEKFDGTGYPANLNGYDIPFLSRIIAVADALDAMISERFYQEPMQPEDALMRIEQDSGKHFDPDIVNKIIETYDSLKKSEMSNA
ncbi:MAG: HD-GYP domain-containing protein, partial [bacterium]